jgi:hypothetical protein
VCTDMLHIILVLGQHREMIHFFPWFFSPIFLFSKRNNTFLRISIQLNFNFTNKFMRLTCRRCVKNVFILFLYSKSQLDMWVPHMPTYLIVILKSEKIGQRPCKDALHVSSRYLLVGFSKKKRTKISCAFLNF